MQTLRRTIVIATMFMVAIACKNTRWREDKSGSEGGSAPKTPEKIADADPKADGATAAGFDLEDKSGRLKSSRLVLRLDYFAEPKAGGTNLPACLRPLAPDFELGVATCDGKPENKISVWARNVDQECYTDNKAPRQAATT